MLNERVSEWTASQKLRVLDLFSGIGGFSLGLERTGGFETVAFCEIDPFCRRVLAKHWPKVPCYEDVCTLNADTLVRDGIGIDVICGGFPCQDVTYAGKRAGLEGARSGLWSEYARLIGELRPRFVIVENVPGLLSLGMGTVLGDLAALRYDAVWDCVSAASVGAPHRRDRVWIIAHAEGGGARRDGQGRDGQGRDGQGREQELDRRSADVDASNTMREGGRVQPLSPRRGDQADAIDDGASRYVADARRQPAQVSATGRQPAVEITEWHSWWAVEPDVGRVANGVPRRVDRLSALGNAVVPQIPELIGRAILKARFHLTQTTEGNCQ